MKKHIFGYRTFLLQVVLLLTVAISPVYATETSATETSAAEEETVEGLSQEIQDLFKDFGSYLDRTRLLTVGELQNLPLGLQTKIGNTCCDLLITQAEFGPQYTELTAFLKITSPQFDGGQVCLFFGGEHIRITSTGGYVGDVKLALLSEVKIGGKGGGLKVVFNGSKKAGETPPTYAIIDCNGFKELNVSGSLYISQDYARRVHNGEVVKSDLRIDFSCFAKSLDQIMAEIQIPEFELTAFPDWRFKAEKAIFDFSVTKNYFSMDYYKIPGEKLYDGFPELWTGVYIEDLSIQFPNYIKNRKDGKSPTFKAERLWLDERGFSGVLQAQNLLKVEDGEIGSWMFSVDNIGITIVSNRITQGKMEGEIRLPIDLKNGFNYLADFSDNGKMTMKVAMNEKMSFDLWKSNSVELYKNSYIKVSKKDSSSEVHLLANLSGRMVIDPTRKVSSASLDSGTTKGSFRLGNIGFSGLKISNQQPYLQLDKLSLESDIRVGNFPMMLRDIALRGIGDTKSSLDFGMDVKIGKNNSGNFKGSLDFSIKSCFNYPKGSDSARKWEFDGFDVKELKVKFDNVAFLIEGGAKFYENDKRYGTGFQGSAKFQIKKGIKFGLEGNVMFGAMPTYRYWYVDVMALFEGVGIIIYPGFQISGIGGGAYQSMKMESDFESNTMGERLTQTGIRYLPDSNISLGFKAFCRISTSGSDLFTADFSLSLALNKSNGLDHITLQGVAQLLPKIDMSGLSQIGEKITKAVRSDTSSLPQERANASQQSAFTAIARFTYDHSNESFYGLFDSYLNMGLIKGVGTDGHIGACEMYFSNPKWFIHVGTPQQRLGIKLDLGLIDIRTTCYFMTGCDLPPMPALPTKLQQLLKTEQKNQLPSSRPITEINGGKGLAFGADISVNTGDLNFWLLFARFESSIGFDVMLKKYQGVFCQGKKEVLGLNGWYATGQAYAYLFGDIGLRLKIFGAKRNFSILQGEVGTLLEAQLPRPAYFGGAIGLNFSILGGLFHGSCHFKFSLGEKCEMIQSGFADGTEIISEARPTEASSPVDVFTVPQVAFNLPMEEEITAVFDGESSHLKLLVDHYHISNKGQELKGQIVWDKEKKLAQWVPQDILPPHTECELAVKVSAKEKQGSTWKALNTIEGGNYTESKNLKFSTGDAPDSIPWCNVKAMYPVPDQKYFHIKEKSNGFILLHMGQPDLISDPKYKQKVLFIGKGGDTISEAFSYNKSERRLLFKVPNLKPQEQYTLQCILSFSGTTQQGGSTQSTQILNGEDGNTLETDIQGIKEDALQQNKDKVLLSTVFSTSQYATMSEKIQAIELPQFYRVPYMWVTPNGKIFPSPIVHYLQAQMKASEGFDPIELFGSKYSGGPLIRTQADTTNEPYFKQQITPLVYQEYPYENLVNFRRNPGEGLIPTWAIYVSSFYKEEENDLFPWMYYLPYHYKLDFDKVITDLAAANLPKRHPYKTWLSKSFIPMPQGIYPISFTYTLPDGSLGSQTKVSLVNPIE